MAYYAGDYYRGDYGGSSYARGDLWGSIGSVLRKVAPVAAGFIPGLGGLVGKVIGGAATAGGIAAGLPAGVPGGFPTLPAGGGALTLGGGFGGGVVVPSGRSIMHPIMGGKSVSGIPRGYHINKSSYATHGGGTSKWPTRLELHPAGSVAVKNRRMHVTNPRAALRALRRLHGFARVARKIYKITHPRPGKAGGRFVAHRRKRK